MSAPMPRFSQPSMPTFHSSPQMNFSRPNFVRPQTAPQFRSAPQFSHSAPTFRGQDLNTRFSSVPGNGTVHTLVPSTRNPVPSSRGVPPGAVTRLGRPDGNLASMSHTGGMSGGAGGKGGSSNVMMHVGPATTTSNNWHVTRGPSQAVGTANTKTTIDRGAQSGNAAHSPSSLNMTRAGSPGKSAAANSLALKSVLPAKSLSSLASRTQLDHNHELVKNSVLTKLPAAPSLKGLEGRRGDRDWNRFRDHFRDHDRDFDDFRFHNFFHHRFFDLDDRAFNSIGLCFGGIPSWCGFVNSCAFAPWFSFCWPYVCTYPWVFGYYNPVSYYNYGYATPVWNGSVYAPWEDWCSAPFVYYYYQHPARFAVNLGGELGDDSYTDLYSGPTEVAEDTTGRPLGIYVPGHYEENPPDSGQWDWVPGYYSY